MDELETLLKYLPGGEDVELLDLEKKVFIKSVSPIRFRNLLFPNT